MKTQKMKVAIIVAHPDDETLWAGGTISGNPQWDCFILSLCRGKDIDRSVKFKKVLSIYNASGIMADLDDSPEQLPLNPDEVENTILSHLPPENYDLIITHNPAGEYTRHRRHEETGKAVITLWQNGKIHTDMLWIFAYEDDNKNKYPEADKNSNFYTILSDDIWLKKYKIITETYGFGRDGWEALTTPRSESFWQFKDAETAHNWLIRFENLHT
jgi:hypothetical protein